MTNGMTEGKEANGAGLSIVMTSHLAVQKRFSRLSTDARLVRRITVRNRPLAVERAAENPSNLIVPISSPPPVGERMPKEVRGKRRWQWCVGWTPVHRTEA